MNNFKSLFVKNNASKKNAPKNNASKNNASKNNGAMNAMNVVEVEENVVMKNNSANNAGLATQPFTQTPNQAGGVAPLGMRDANLQPSKAVMDWATTAGAPTPPENEMRNVAHGGARKTRKHKKSKKSHKKSKKSHKGRKSHKSHKKGKKSHKRK